MTGGARAGKSRWVEEEARRLAGEAVTYVATAEALDAEMTRRIAAHRAERPVGWTTVEEPRNVARAVADARHDTVVVDCLTLWVSNLMCVVPEAGEPAGRQVAEARVRDAVDHLLATVGARPGTLLLVTNEVGLGLVPENPMARAYRDQLGRVNARIARDAERVIMMVAGVPLHVR